MTPLASFIASFVALFAVVEPFGVVPMFASLTQGRVREEQLRVATRASIVGALILLTFAVIGPALLNFLGVRMDAFRVAGSIVLLLGAIEMIRGKTGCRCSASEADPTRADLASDPRRWPSCFACSDSCSRRSRSTRSCAA